MTSVSGMSQGGQEGPVNWSSEDEKELGLWAGNDSLRVEAAVRISYCARAGNKELNLSGLGLDSLPFCIDRLALKHLNLTYNKLKPTASVIYFTRKYNCSTRGNELLLSRVRETIRDIFVKPPSPLHQHMLKILSEGLTTNAQRETLRLKLPRLRLQDKDVGVTLTILTRLPADQRSKVITILSEMQLPQEFTVDGLQLLSEMPETKRLYFKFSMEKFSEADRGYVLQIISKIHPDERVNLIGQFNRLRMDISDCSSGLEILSRIPDLERKSFIDQVKELEPRGNSLDSLKVLSRISSNARGVFIDQFSRLELQRQLPGREGLHFLWEIPAGNRDEFITQFNLLELLPHEKREAFKSIGEHVPGEHRAEFLLQLNRLQLPRDHRLEGLQRVCQVSVEERAGYIEQVIQLNLSEADRLKWLECLQKIPANERVEFINQLNRLPLSSEAKKSLLAGLSEYNRDQRQELITVARELSTNYPHVAVDRYITIFRRIPADGRREFHEQALTLFRICSFEDPIQILQDFALKSRENRTVLVRNFVDLSSHIPIENLQSISARRELWNHLIQIRNPADVLAMATQLIGTYRLERANPITVLKIAERIRQDGMPQFIQQANNLMCRGISSDQRVRLLELLARFPEGIRPIASRQCRPTMGYETHFMTNSRIEDLERFFRSIEQRNLQQPPRVVIASQRPRAVPGFFQVNPVELSANPTAILMRLPDAISSNRGSFPQVMHVAADGRDLPGVDAGGLGRSLATGLFRGVFREGQQKLPFATHNELFIPKIKPNEHLDLTQQVACYRGVGAMFGVALRNQAPLLRVGQEIHPLVFKMMHSLSHQEMAQISDQGQIPQPLTKKLREIYIKSIYPSYSSDLVSRIADRTATENDLGMSVDDFYEGIGMDEVICATGVMAKSMIGDLTAREWDGIKGASPAEFQTKIQGSLSSDGVGGALRFSDGNTRGIEAYLRRWVGESTPQKHGDLVECTTGLRTLRDGEQLNVRIYSYEGNPGFHTCGRVMDLYPVADYETFKTNLENSMTACLGSGGFTTA